MSREFILDKIRSNQQVDETGHKARKAAVEARLRESAVGVLPKVPSGHVQKVNQFIRKAEATQSSVVRVRPDTLGKAISEFLRKHNLPAEICLTSDTRFDGLRQQMEKSIAIKKAPGDGSEITGVSHAECGVAETGTLALISGPENPSTNNFLPENHIVVVRETDIVKHYEELWPRIRKRFGAGKMPRTVNFITGPSRSADIEQTLLLGAHGPVRLQILLVRDTD